VQSRKQVRIQYKCLNTLKYIAPRPVGLSYNLQVKSYPHQALVSVTEGCTLVSCPLEAVESAKIHLNIQNSIYS